MTIRLALVGFGKIAHDQHLPVVQASPAFTLAATVSKHGQGIDGTPHFVSDIKRVRCVAVEGALPHIVPAQQGRFSMDLRTKKGAVVTFQKDRDGHSLWRGAYYTLADLEPANLRQFEHWDRPSFEVAR